MRVTHRMLARSVNRNLKNNMYNLDKRSNQMSTGRLFDRPSQDPAGTYKVMRIAGTGLTRNAQFNRNIGEGISWLSATEDALAGAIDAIHRLRDIAVYTANGDFTHADRLTDAPEVKQLLEYLIDIGNTELAGLYLFGGHQTLQKPYGVAGEGGCLLNTWQNKTCGLVADPNGAIGITVEDFAPGNYAVSTARGRLAPIGGLVTSGPGGQDEQIELEFTLDGQTYTVTANGTDDDRPVAITHIVDAVNGDADLSLLIQAAGVDSDGDGLFDSVRFDLIDPAADFSLKINPTDPHVFGIDLAAGTGVTVVSEHLQGPRSGFLGTEQIVIDPGSTANLGGSLALEIVKEIRYQDLNTELQQQIGGDTDDRIIRLAAHYLLRDTEGTNFEGDYGLRDGEDIYLNLNRLVDGRGQVAVKTKGGDIILNIGGYGTLTFEQDIPLVGDKLVLHLHPPQVFTTTETADRFTLHRDYGQTGEAGNPATGKQLDWFFNSGGFDDKVTALKFYDLDPISGELFVSTVNAKFDVFAPATAREYQSLQDICRHGVPDEHYSEYPAAIFTFVPAGEVYFQGDGGQRLLEIAPGITVPANISGLYAFDYLGADGVGLFGAVDSLYQALLSNDYVALGGSVLEALDGCLDNLLKSRSELGARMQRLYVTEDRHHSETIFLRELRSKTEDIDMADIITEYMLQETVYQAALATGARTIYPSLVDFLR